MEAPIGEQTLVPGGPDHALALMVAVARGDQSALGALYDTYGSQLLAIGLRMLRARAAAEDVLHDVFVEVWQRAGTYDASRGTVWTWLAMRMRSRCLDRLRSAAWRAGTSSVAVDDGHPQLVTEPVEPNRPDLDRIASLMRTLSDEHQEVIALAYFEGLTMPEIADRISIPVGTVKSRVRVALERLRDGVAG